MENGHDFPSSINDIILNPFPPYIPLLERFFLRCLAAEYFAAPPYADPFLSAPIKFSIVFFHSGMAVAGIPEFADKALGAAEFFSEYADPGLFIFKTSLQSEAISGYKAMIYEPIVFTAAMSS